MTGRRREPGESGSEPVWVSALTGEGVEGLKTVIRERLDGGSR